MKPNYHPSSRIKRTGGTLISDSSHYPKERSQRIKPAISPLMPPGRMAPESGGTRSGLERANRQQLDRGVAAGCQGMGNDDPVRGSGRVNHHGIGMDLGAAGVVSGLRVPQ